MGNQLMCESNQSPQDFSQNSIEYAFNFSNKLAHSELIVQQNFVIKHKQNQNGLSQVALIYQKLPQSGVSFQFKIRNGTGVKIGIAQKDTIEKNKFEIDYQLKQTTQHGFYVIDSDGYQYKNNVSGNGKISSSGLNFNDEHVIVGCDYEPRKGIISWQIKNRDTRSQNQQKNSQKDVFRMQVDTMLFKLNDYHPCVIFGLNSNQVEILRVSYHS